MQDIEYIVKANRTTQKQLAEARKPVYLGKEIDKAAPVLAKAQEFNPIV